MTAEKIENNEKDIFNKHNREDEWYFLSVFLYIKLINKNLWQELKWMEAALFLRVNERRWRKGDELSWSDDNVAERKEGLGFIVIDCTCVCVRTHTGRQWCSDRSHMSSGRSQKRIKIHTPLCQASIYWEAAAPLDVYRLSSNSRREKNTAVNVNYSRQPCHLAVVFEQTLERRSGDRRFLLVSLDFFYLRQKTILWQSDSNWGCGFFSEHCWEKIY